MPLASPLPRRALVRLAVLGSGVVALAGCGALDRVPRPAPRRREDDADETLVAAALADQQRVLAVAVATRSVHPALAATLDPVVEHHRTHVTVLGGSPDDASTPSPTASTSPSATASPNLPTISADPAVALSELGAAERAAGEARGSNSTAAASGDLARVLAAMAAGQAQHVVVLAAAAASLGDGS
ncbi:hypothetical protein [Solicola sp. PLA-1-18]|uniref:hypothetical protein n=1 Tax=Solicola sp. PLA-1-18 TaxID=3380532 RepID=UPI003B7DBC78